MENKKAQLKIQQMAFVLIALVIFFAIVALIYLTVRLNTLKKDVQASENDKARELLRKLSGIPELKWTGDCDSCIDMDKALVLKSYNKTYNGFFGLDYLSFQVIYPKKTDKECVVGNYPNCNKITLIQTSNFGNAPKAYVSLCRWDQNMGSEKCELGAVYAAGKAIK
ncbi:hypothetical protein J4217_00445 [Candidatus Pacearchaeota archaeon]|nr:hypothetical protein [Candidatus Pacearchaeota archaeon]